MKRSYILREEEELLRKDPVKAPRKVRVWFFGGLFNIVKYGFVCRNQSVSSSISFIIELMELICREPVMASM